MKTLLAVAMLILPLAAAPQSAKKQNPASGINFYSIERELKLGKQLSEEIRKQAKLVEDPIVTEYISRICQNIARNSDVTFPVSINLIESDEIGAFALPGGFLYVNTGTLMLSDNEAELASVIAHELGHTAARHATRQVTQQQLLNAASLPVFVFGGLGGALAKQVGAPLAFSHYSRVYESEADLLGIQYLWKAGYDPEASVSMFERVEATERARPGAVSQLFRTHPMTADRIAKTQKDIGRILADRPEYVINTSEYEDIRARLHDLLEAQKAKDAPTRPIPTLRRPSDHEAP